MNITNRKYKLLKESLGAIKDGDINILTLFGSAGMGKTFTTLEYLKEQNVNYTYINSYATPLSFYEILYNSRNKKIVIFDDVFNINNPLILAMLKSACWTSDGKKIVSYYSTSSKMDLRGLPSSFEFDSNVVLIYNKLLKEYDPITNRGITINFDFSFEDKIEIFNDLKDNVEKDILDYVKINCSEATTNLSIRSLVILSKLKQGGKDFKLFAKEMLKPDENKKLLIEMGCKEWVSKTGFSRRSYFRHKHKFKLNEKSAIVPYDVISTSTGNA